MAKSREIRNVTIVGTGVIGASWRELYLGRGLNVTAMGPLCRGSKRPGVPREEEIVRDIKAKSEGK
jgi:3-hydroxyacyl-CoA dehydrogenase